MVFMKCDRIDDCMQEKLLRCFFVRQDPKLLSNLVLKKFFAMEPSLQKIGGKWKYPNLCPVQFRLDSG